MVSIQAAEEADPYVRKIGLVDMGSGTIRLVVYGQKENGDVTKIFTEQAQCSLGQSVAKKGKINAEAMQCAIDSLSDFKDAALAQGVEENDFHAFATAAVRTASNKKKFRKAAKAATGTKIKILSGKKEAKLGGIGAMQGVDNEGKHITADLGRTSLDMTEWKNGKPRKPRSPIVGSSEVLALGKNKSQRYIQKELDRDAPGLPKGAALHLVGGTWRRLAKAYLRSEGINPKEHLHGYRVSFAEFDAFLDDIEQCDSETLQSKHRIPKYRIEHLAPAVSVLRALAKKVKTTELVFSKFGVREGFVLKEILNGEALIEKPEPRPKLVASSSAPQPFIPTADAA